ncbi:Signal recognition particle receptor beta subunit [Carpediemonas membranifera]|uniref:Signal recognition particle receptor beta subunit n=1 Tax=Carpediemonas membranifera TaxID=201153 RepID=A0A8J6ASQ9_9EUKA|nr:Signal recognition particle receptor beta subunit [Carpediemonas membranifera]|eukprot:KAG9393133.1 Signal recognition particle receptor beta subunit [Carpediemonas membranifera]
MVGCISFLFCGLFGRNKSSSVAILGLSGTGKTKLAYFLHSGSLLETCTSVNINRLSCHPDPRNSRTVDLIDVPSHMNASLDTLSKDISAVATIVVLLTPGLAASTAGTGMNDTVQLVARLLTMTTRKTRIFLGVNDDSDPGATVTALETAMTDHYRRRQQAGMKDSSGQAEEGVFLLPGQAFSFEKHASCPVTFGRVSIPRTAVREELDISTLMPQL